MSCNCCKNEPIIGSQWECVDYPKPKRQTLYLAGKMRGLPGLNFHVFDHWKQELERKGFTVISPADLSRASGFHPGLDDMVCKNSGRPDRDMRAVMATDLTVIASVDGIALIPGWESSLGTTVELAYAQFLGLPVYDATTGELLVVRSKPWNWALEVQVDYQDPCSQKATVSIKPRN